MTDLISRSAYKAWLHDHIYMYAQAPDTMSREDYGVLETYDMAVKGLDAAPAVSCAACKWVEARGSRCCTCYCGDRFSRREGWNDNRPAGCKQWDKEHPEVEP